MRDIPDTILNEWPSPNYTDPDTRGNSALIVGVGFLIISLVVVTARLYTRIFVKRTFGLDDGLIVVASVLIRSPKYSAAIDHLELTPNPNRSSQHYT